MRCSAQRLCESVCRCVVPSTWSSTPWGWYMFPDNSTPADVEWNVSKTFVFLNHSAQYRLLGQVMSYAEELRCIPLIHWFYAELTVTLPPTADAELIAKFMNDEERRLCGLRNQSRGTSASDGLWSTELRRRLESDANNHFCWCLTGDVSKTDAFLSDTYVKWYHRSDYIISRMSREKKEFREDLSMKKVIVEGRERKRRMQRRKISEDQRAKDIAEQQRSEYDTMTADVLPRDVREMLDRDNMGSPEGPQLRPGGTFSARLFNMIPSGTKQ